MSDQALAARPSAALDLALPVGPQVFRTLRHEIVTNRLRPGQRLSEQEIAQSLGVSRQPVREAFIKLGEAGLVRARPQRGTLVVRISTRQVGNARFVREAVERAVARRAALGFEPGRLDALRQNLDWQAQAGDADDNVAFQALDDAFHQGLAQGIGCVEAWRAVEGVKAQMDRVRFLSLPHASPIDRLIGQHRAILDAVAEGDPDAAEGAMERHMAEILIALPALVSRYPDLFEDDSA